MPIPIFNPAMSKETLNKRIGIRVSEAFYGRLEACAATNRRSKVSDYVRILLEDGLERDESELITKHPIQEQAERESELITKHPIQEQAEREAEEQAEKPSPKEVLAQTRQKLQKKKDGV